MNRKTLLIGGGAALVAALVIGYVMLSGGKGQVDKAPGQHLAEELGLKTGAPTDSTETRDEREMKHLESGEAQKSIDKEIEKAEALLKKYGSDTEEHRVLSRRIAMLKRLKENMSR